MTLDIGGTKLIVGRSTLAKVPDSSLAALFSGQAPVTKTGEGCVFLDRNPQIFKYVIDYLQSDLKYLPQDVSDDTKKLIEIELEHWKLIPQNKINAIQLLDSEPEMYSTNTLSKKALDLWRTL